MPNNLFQQPQDLPFSNIPYSYLPPGRDMGGLAGAAMEGMGSGGGWLGNLFGNLAGGGGGGGLASTLGGGGLTAALGGPVGIGLMGLNLVGGLLGGISANKKQKKKEEAYKKAQADYQAQAKSLFPEMDKSSFQYQNPALNNAYQSALAYRLGNMFTNWGMPENMRQNAGSVNDLFAQMMTPSQQGGGMPPGGGSVPGGGGHPPVGGGGGGQRGGGDPKRKRSGGGQRAPQAW